MIVADGKKGKQLFGHRYEGLSSHAAKGVVDPLGEISEPTW
jgi:hypothetical protein